MAYYRGIGSARSSSASAPDVSPPASMPPPPTSLLPQSGRPWSRAEDKVFESALVAYPEHIEKCWAFVASQLPGRTTQEVLEHYDALVADVDLIESGMVEIPNSCDDDNDKSARATAGRRRCVERRPSVPWSEEEHKLFLEGLSKYKRGDWRNISRVIKTRMPIQVARHAHKYFLRLAKAASRGNTYDKNTQDITAE